jgi:nucleoside-diphosphate-sugar epimerase
MRVFVAGATGALGRPLVKKLLERGHDVTGLTRDPVKGAELAAAGATPVIADIFEAETVLSAIEAARPDAIISELTALPQRLNPRKLAQYYAANDRVRREGTRTLLKGARRINVPRIVSQSSAFWYAPTPGLVKTEAAPFDTEAPEPIRTAVATMIEVEEMIMSAAGLSAVNVRYATLYGPRTWYSANGEVGQRFRKRMYPMIGSGEAIMSFVHVDDAATATIAALESGATGAFNVADDEPAVASEWMPLFAEAIGAPKPLHAPVFLARLLAGRAAVHLAVNSRAASNTRLKDELGWRPRFESWRTGFYRGFS